LRGGGRELALALALLAAVVFAAHTPQWRALEFKTFDVYASLTRTASAVPIVLVTIDEPTLQQLGLPYPFPRRVHAALVDRLARDGARVIAFDVLFADPGPPEDTAVLAGAIANAGNVVLAMNREQVETANSRQWLTVEPLPALLSAGAISGDVGVDPDADFVVRLAPAADDAFARVIARRADARALPAPPADAPQFIRYVLPDSFAVVHFYQALSMDLVPPGYFKDRIVLVGLSLRSSPELMRRQADLYNSPFLETESRLMPGVEIHANFLANLLERRTLTGAPASVPLWLALAAALIVAAANRWTTPFVAGAIVVTIAMLAAAASGLLITRGNVWLSPLVPATAAAAVYVGSTALAFFDQRQRARETKRAFAQYVPSEVVNRLVEHPELLALGGEARELTLLFADLANFTTLSERLPPTTVIALLTEYLDAMSTIIHQHGGTVDKYIGDGIMAFWGAPLPDPDHAADAVRAALQMQQAMAPIAQSAAAQGWPGLAMRIGIHTGTVIVGNVGSRARFAYTAVGDAVNIAARLEGENKNYGTSILLSEATARALPPDLPVRPVDAVTVKGRVEAVVVYTPCADPALATQSRAALDAWRRGDRDASLALWRALLATHPGDSVAATFVARGERAPTDGR
jgi:adenylate cyclase